VVIFANKFSARYIPDDIASLKNMTHKTLGLRYEDRDRSYGGAKQLH